MTSQDRPRAVSAIQTLARLACPPSRLEIPQIVTRQVKEALEHLAIFGGQPAFREYRHVGRPNLGSRERFLERVNEIWDRNWLTSNGPCVNELEHQLAELTGVKHCIATSNGTVALELAIRALGFTGEVIVPSFTFVGTVHALQWQEITPVFCDIEPATYTIDPAQIERLITPRTSGIIGVHLWGRICDVVSLIEIARRRSLKLLFDAAHALGCSHGGRMVGGFGDAEVISLHATKFVNSFEGGAVLTSDDSLAKKVRLMKNFGFVGFDDVAYLGINGKLPEVSAAMGLTSLESMSEFISINRRNYHRYKSQLRDIPGVRLVASNENEKCNYQYITIELDTQHTNSLTRDALVRVLQAEGVLVRRYFYPACHNMEPYRSYFPHAKLLLPVTERVKDLVISLPTGTSISEADVDLICDLIRYVISHGQEISERLAHGSPGVRREPVRTL